MKSIKKGDVFSCSVDGKTAYIQCLEKIDKFGYICRVLDGKFNEDVTEDDLIKLVNSKEIYHIWCQLNVWVNKGFVSFVRNFKIPQEHLELPKFISGGIKSSPESDTREDFGMHWFESGELHWKKIGKILPVEFLDLSVTGSVGFELFQDRIASNWRPRDFYLDFKWK